MRIRLFVLVLFGITKCESGHMEPFIVGGAFARSIEDFPHVAFLLLTESGGYETTCGSSIINQYILVTAAHCTNGVRKIIASVGSVNRNRGKAFVVSAYKLHSSYNERSVTNDIALCKLKYPLTFGRSVKRVLIMRHPPKTLKGKVAGWGAVEEKYYTESEKLKYVEQLLWTYQKCRGVLRGCGVPSGTICGGPKRSNSRFCSTGDSGSGLLVQGQVLIGVVSFKCVQLSRSLVVYSDVTHFYDWIKRAGERMVRC